MSGNTYLFTAIVHLCEHYQIQTIEIIKAKKIVKEKQSLRQGLLLLSSIQKFT